MIPGVFHKRLTPKQKTSHNERFPTIYRVLCQASCLCSGLLISPHFLYYYPQPQLIANDYGVILPNALYIERPLEVSDFYSDVKLLATYPTLWDFEAVSSDFGKYIIYRLYCFFQFSQSFFVSKHFPILYV